MERMRTMPAAAGRTRVLALAAAVGLLGAAGLAACSSGPSATPVVTAYLSAWSKGDLPAAAAQTDDPAAATKGLTDARSALSAQSVRATREELKTSGKTARATFTATVAVGGLGDWRYAGALPLRLTGGVWRVAWSPAVIHPALGPGGQLVVSRSLAPRASLVGAGGKALFTDIPTTTVGIEPDKLGPAGAQTLGTVAAASGVDLAALTRNVSAAAPTAFVPVITLRDSDYQRIKGAIHDLPGTVFRMGSLPLPPTPTFACALVGRVGPATADALKAAGPAYVGSDQIGLDGLQAAYQQRLAGTPSGAVTVKAVGGATTTLQEFPGTPGAPVTSTLDGRLQEAAEAALGPVGPTASLVVVQPSTGNVMAVANRPATSALDTGLVGQYPPGSTFKVVSTYGLLTGGLAADAPVPCPATLAVGGKVFRNFEGEAPGSIPFATAFAISCNTAFVGLSNRLSGTRLPDAARALGIGTGWKLPLPAYAGAVPVPMDAVDQAAETIGQGRITVSPLSLALVAAAVQSGTWRPPVLVTDPAQPAGPPPQPLDPAAAAALRSLMAGVVTGAGTAATAGLPPGTAGKTGTAEFGNATPPSTHAWFVGYRGDLALAVLVEGGGVGGRVAAPIAAAFLNRIGAAP